MSNLYQGTASGLAILKQFYQGPLQTQFNDECPIYRGAEKGKYNWSGSVVIRPLKMRRNQGIGATAEGGILPAIGRQGTVQAQINAKYNYIRFGVTGVMIKASQADVGSFVRSAAYELSESYNDLMVDVNRQMGWDGTGDLARMNAASVASTSIVIKGREDTEAALKFLDIGASFDIYTSAGVLVQSGITINSITTGTGISATATIVTDVPVTASADDVLVRANSFGQEIQGLLTQLDGLTTTVFNIARADFIQAQGNVVDLSAGQLTLDALQRAQDEAERRGGRGVNAIYCDYASRRMYQKLLTADKRYVNTVKGDGGFAAKDKNYLEFNGIPLVADQSAPTRFFFLPDKFIEQYTLANMEFADETGSQFIADSEVDQFETRVRFFSNLFNSKAAGSAVVRNYVSP